MVLIGKGGINNPYAAILLLYLAATAASLMVFAATNIAPSPVNSLAPMAGFDMVNPEVQNYLSANKYFSDLEYKNLLPGTSKEYVLKSGNVQDNIRGVEVAGQRYAIELVLCNWNEQACFFRVNGKPTGGLHEFRPGFPNDVSSYNVNNLYELRVNSISFDNCGNRRFCNLHYDAYDVVNITAVYK